MKNLKVLCLFVICLMVFIVSCTSSPQIEKKVVVEQKIAERSSPPLSSPQESSPKVSSPPVNEKASSLPLKASLPLAEVSVKTVSIIAKQWSFEPALINVKKGDRVHLTITSKDVTHGFNIPEYGINEKINPGKTTQVEFVADKVGTFSFFCSVPCGKGHTGMNGQLIVQE